MCSDQEHISMQETSEQEVKRLQAKARASGQRGLLLNLNDETHNEFPIEVLELIDLNELYLSISNLSSIPSSICTLKHLKILELRNNDFGTFPEAVCGLKNLEILDLSANKISSLPDAIANLGNLKTLALQSNKLQGELSKTIATLRSLQHLNVSRNSLTTIPDAFEDLSELQHLIVSVNLFTEAPEVLTKMTKLKTLDISYNDLKQLNLDISGLNQLENLDLESTKLSVLDEGICKLTSLKRLDLGLNNLESIPDSFYNLTNLKALWLNNNKLKCFPSVLCKLRSLENLSLSYNSIKSLPSEMAYLCNLKMLELDSCGLSKMPLSICMLTSLQFLSLANNNLIKLPPVIRTSLPSLSFINLENNNNIKVPPLSISKRGIKAIFNFMDETETKKTIYHKLVLLGNVKAGKSSLAKTMIYDKSHLSEDVDRTVVLDRILWTPEENLSLTVYDFGGSELYCVAQHFFLERNSIVLVVVDLSDYSEEKYTDCVEKWLKITQARAPGAKLFVVGTHTDTLSQDEVVSKQKSILEMMHAREKCEVDHVHQEIARLQEELGKEAETAINRLQMSLNNRLLLPEMVYAVSSKNLDNFKQLRGDLLETAKDVGGDIPTSWLRLHDVLHNSELSKSKSFLTLEDVVKLDRDAYEIFQAQHNLSPSFYRKHPPLQSRLSMRVIAKRDTQKSEEKATRIRKISDQSNPLRPRPTENDEKSTQKFQRLTTIHDAENVYTRRLSSDAGPFAKIRLQNILAFFHSIGDVLWYEGNPQIRNFVFHKQSFIIDLLKSIFSESPVRIQDLQVSLKQGMTSKSLGRAKDELRRKGIMSVGLLKGMLDHLHLDDSLIDAIMQLLVHFGLCFAEETEGSRITKLHFPWFLSESEPPAASLMLNEPPIDDCYRFILEYDFPLGSPRAFFETASVRIHSAIHDEVSIKHWKRGVYARLQHSKIVLNRSESPDSETISFSVEGKDIDELWKILARLHKLFKSLLDNWPGSLLEMWLVCPHCTSRGIKNPYRFQGENIEKSCPEDEDCVTCPRDDEGFGVPVNLVYPKLASAHDVTEDQILNVARLISKHWRALGRALGLDEYELESLDYDNRELREKSIQMLRQWQRTKGKKANLSGLIEALNTMDPRQQIIIDELTNITIKEEAFEAGFPPDSLLNTTL